MVRLKAAGAVAVPATVSVAVEGRAADVLPLAGSQQRQMVSTHPATKAWRRRRTGGFAPWRVPAATAKIAAAAASSRALARRPPSDDFASFELPAGSVVTRASPIAYRSSRDGPGVTRPSSTARRKPRTSSAPSLKPWPRISSAAGGTPAASSASRSSASRQRSATILAGRPNRSSASRSNPPRSTARCPERISSPRSPHR